MSAELAGRIAEETQARVLFDWAGGLLWLEPEADGDTAAAIIARAVAASGGHAMLMRAPASVRASVEAFSPHDAALAALTKRVKESFDPRGILNPGRMWAGV